VQPTVPQAWLVGRVLVLILSARVEIPSAAGHLAAHSLTPFRDTSGRRQLGTSGLGCGGPGDHQARGASTGIDAIHARSADLNRAAAPIPMSRTSAERVNVTCRVLKLARQPYQRWCRTIRMKAPSLSSHARASTAAHINMVSPLVNQRASNQARASARELAAGRPTPPFWTDRLLPNGTE